MARRLRLWSGLVMFVFIATHLLNHALGIISIDAAEKRITRGLSKLRAILARRGLHTPSDALESSLTGLGLTEGGKG